MSHVVGESRGAGGDDPGTPRSGAPAVLAFDAHGRLVHHSASATALLELVLRADALPASVARAVRELGAERACTVRGRDGHEYLLHVVPAAAHAGADPDAPSTFVVIAGLRAERGDDEDAGGGDTALVAQRYGLSPREHEILRRVSRGDATKAIAAALGLSTHTVQEYVGRACRKAGVRTRRELVARLLERAGEP